jgi:hypothetical protein
VFELETGLMLRKVRKLPKPSDSLVLSLRFQLETTKLEQPLTSLRVVVPDLRRASARQRSLDGRSREDLLRNATASVRELQAMYGDNAVQNANDIEQPRRNRLFKAWRDATGWR